MANHSNNGSKPCCRPTCDMAGVEQELSAFYTCKTSRDGHRSVCKRCMQKERATYTKRAKDAAFEAYGGYKCVCCGEANPKFLTLDHINGGGRANRRNQSGIGFYVWLRNNNYSADLQVLCYNCNCGRAHNNGVCPHKELEHET